MEKNSWFYKLIDAFSLTGAILLMLFSLTLYGVMTKQKEIWQNFGTAFTTFVSAKQITKYDSKNPQQ